MHSDFEHGEPLRVLVRCAVRADVQQVRCTLTARGDYGPLFRAISGVAAHWAPGSQTLECVFQELPLLPGLYRLDVELTHSGAADWTLPRALTTFRVVTDLARYGSDSLVGATKSRGGFLAVAYDWRLRTTAGEQTLPGLRLPRNMTASRPP